MADIKKHKLYFIGAAYWFLLLYIVSALVWWFISLEAQNKQMYIFRYEQLKKEDALYTEKVEALDDAKMRKSLQYVGEGLTFFVLIMVGAAYIYRMIRMQMKDAEQQQNFMMAITHELKTPIAVARLNLETIQRRQLQPEQQQKLLNGTLAEMDRLNTLTSNILTAAQLEDNHHTAQLQEVNFSEVLHHALKGVLARHKNREVTTEITNDLWVSGEPILLQLLASNLIDNALKYTKSGDPVQVQLDADRELASLQVADGGQGVSDVEKKKIFEKFYRVGNESIRKTKGTGLGLFLCKKIVKYHKGKITLQDNDPKGCIFTVQIPLLK